MLQKDFLALQVIVIQIYVRACYVQIWKCSYFLIIIEIFGTLAAYRLVLILTQTISIFLFKSMFDVFLLIFNEKIFFLAFFSRVFKFFILQYIAIYLFLGVGKNFRLLMQSCCFFLFFFLPTFS